jgi:uncharacterized protein YbaP (TraB family)
MPWNIPPGRYPLRVKLWSLLLVAIACGTLPSPCRADGHHIFWEVHGKHNTVYLLGSVHMLKPGDSALPPEALRAYAQSRKLVMELDLNAADAGDSLLAETAAALLPEGQTLESVLGPSLYASFATQAEAVGLDPQLAERFQPWFAALMLEQFELAKAGFDAQSGVDMQFAQRAQSDGKPIIGLETVDEQLGIFANLSMPQQCDYLRATLSDASSEVSDAAKVVQAWEQGDAARLEQLLREGSKESPELYQRLTIDRNRRWLPKITQMLNDDSGNYLIIVGALHLIGHDGVIDLLQRSGYSPVQH